MILPERTRAIRHHSPDKIVRYSLSVNARSVSLWIAPLEASVRTAFAIAVSSGASAIRTISYWPVTMKNSFRVTPADRNSFRPVSNREGLSLMFSSPLLVQRAKQMYVGIPFLPPGVILFGPVHGCQTLPNLGEDRMGSKYFVRGNNPSGFGHGLCRCFCRLPWLWTSTTPICTRRVRLNFKKPE